MKKVVAGIVIFTGLAGAGYYAWQKKEAPAAETAAPQASAPTPVVTQILATRDVETTLSAVGSLIAGESAEIHTEISGQIEKISFEEGQPVKKGDVLLQIDRSLIETELARAEATHEAVSKTFSRDDKLKQSGFVSRQKWDLSKSELENTQAAVNEAKIRLQKTTIRAPFDGLAGLRSFSVGDYAQVGQALTTIDAINPLKIEFSVPERDYNNVRIGQKIRFSVDAWPGQKFEGEIYVLDPRIDPETRNFRVKANIPNDDGRLRPGMYARIDIAAVTKPDVLMIAEEALVPQGNETFVYVVEDGKAVMKKITIGLRQKGAVEVTEGLEAGQEIVTAGAIRLRDGAAVAPQPSEMSPAAGE